MKKVHRIVPGKTYQLLPSLSTEEYEALKLDIKARGVQVPIEFDERGNVLDGHHRLKICRELGIKNYPSIIRAGLTEQQKRVHVRALNLHRRHLNQKQRRFLIAEQLKDTPGISNRQIAEQLKVDHKTVASVRDTLTGRGEIPHVATVKDTKGRSQPAKRPSIVANGESQVKRAVNALNVNHDINLPDKWIDLKRLERIARSQPFKADKDLEDNQAFNLDKTNIEIRTGDFRKVFSDIKPGSVDLILTDPPYKKEFLSLWDALGKWARQTLKPGGFLVTYSGQTYLPYIYGTLSRYLEYVWTIAQVGSGPKTIIHPVKIYSRWKPILVYAKPPYERERWVEDIILGQGPEKSHHTWQQSEDEARYLLKSFSNIGELVIDPFVGGGTNAVACISTSRKFIGCDIDSNAVVKSRERVNQIVQYEVQLES
jgi:DNA modification methylase